MISSKGTVLYQFLGIFLTVILIQLGSADWADPDEAEDSMSFEMDGNENDRGIGFKPKAKNGTQSRKYPWDAAVPTWTESPYLYEKIKDKGYNDLDDTDKDYFSHYDFEFAKSGQNHPNFQRKYLKYQAAALEARNRTVPTPIPGGGDEADNYFVPKPKAPEQPEKARAVMKNLARVIPF